MTWYTEEKKSKEKKYFMEEKEIPSEEPDQGRMTPQDVSRGGNSKESWYGVFLLLGFGVTVCALIGSTGWWVYRHLYLPTQQEQASIDSLVRGISRSQKNSDSEERVSSEKEAETPKEETFDVKKESVLVLNGGGAKGSAGEVVALLKKEGYEKVSSGNTEKDYTGVTAYFASGKESVADEVKKLLLKRYPKTVSREVVESNKETSGASVVVIIGK